MTTRNPARHSFKFKLPYDWILVGVIFVGVTFLLGLTSTQARLVEAVYAVVNNDLILKSEFDLAWLEFQQNTNSSVTNEQKLKERLLDQMITLKLQQIEAGRMGIRVNDRQLNDQIKRIADRNGLNIQQLFKQLELSGITSKQFRANITQQILVSRLQQSLFANSVQPDESEIQRRYEREMSLNDRHEYQFQLILIESNAQRSASQLEQDTQQVLQQLQAGMDFLEANLLFSDLQSHAAVLDWLNPANIPTAFHQFLLSADINDISAVIETERGNFIIKLINKRNRQPSIQQRYRLQTLTLLKQTYSVEEVNQFFQQIQQAEDKAEAQDKAHDEALATLAKSYSQDINSFNGGRTSWLMLQELPAELATQLNNYEVGQLAMSESDSSYIIFKLLEKETFDASSNLIRQQIQEQLVNEQIQQNYQRYLKNLRNNADVQILADFAQ